MSQAPSGPVEHPLLAAQRLVDAALGGLVEANVWSLSDEEIGVVLDGFTAIEARVAAAKLAVVAEGDARQLGVRDATSTAGWLRSRLRMHPGAAAGTVRLAAALRSDCTATGTALAAGGLSTEHARVISHTITHLPPVQTGIKEQAEEFLIGQAAVLDPLLLRRAAQALTETLTSVPDADGRLVGDIARREFTGVVAADGMVRLHGWLDREAWAGLSAVLDPLAAPRPAADGTPDLRSPARRRGDALPELARLAATATMPPSGAIRPTLSVTIGYHALAGGVRAAGLLNTGEPISPTAARRIACDARIIPAVLGTASQPLDVGRAARTVPAPLHAALVLRDTACAFPGCDRLPAWCQAHHIQHWADGGDTALNNLALLCVEHHHAVHHHGWTVHLDTDGLPVFRPPPWIDPQQQPQQHHRYPLRQLDYDLSGPDPPEE